MEDYIFRARYGTAGSGVVWQGVVRGGGVWLGGGGQGRDIFMSALIIGGTNWR